MGMKQYPGKELYPHLQQRMVDRNGLLPEHVDGSAGDLTVLKRLYKILLVNDPCPCGINQISGFFHLFEIVFIYNIFCIRNNRQMNTDDIALGQSFL